jgi:hypothetical protein
VHAVKTARKASANAAFLKCEDIGLFVLSAPWEALKQASSHELASRA